jgi:hypothetical protein
MVAPEDRIVGKFAKTKLLGVSCRSTIPLGRDRVTARAAANPHGQLGF